MEVLATFDDWSQGHFGEEPRRENGWFGGENFIPVNGGRALKIREALAAMSNTGMANTASVFMAPASSGVIASTGTPCWYVPVGGGAPSALTAFATSTISNTTDWCLYGLGVLVTINNDKTYSVTSAANTALAGSPGGMNVAVLGDRIYLGGQFGLANRIRWSDALSETSWTAGNILDVGINVNEAILGFKRQRDSIVLCTRGNFVSGAWYRLSGTPGSTQTLTPIVRTGPSLPVSAAFVEGSANRVWFPANAGVTATTQEIERYGFVDADMPRTTAGLAASNSVAPGGAALSGPVYFDIGTCVNTGDVLFSAFQLGTATTTPAQRNYLYRNGMWSSHVFNLTGFTATTANSVCVGGENWFYLAHGGSASTKPNFYMWPFQDSLTTAPNETDQGAATVVTGQVHTPVYYDPRNRLMRVQQVQVDYRGYSGNATATVAVTVVGTRAGAFTSPTTGAISGSTSSPYWERAGLYVGNDTAFGTGFQVKLTSCRALAVERITVLGEYEEFST